MQNVLTSTRLRANGEKVYSFRLWPNGEFGIGKLKTVNRYDSRVDAPSASPGASDAAYREHIRRFAEATGLDASGVLCPGLGAIAERVALMDATEVAMGSSNVFNSHKARKRRGSLGITSYSKKILRNGAYLLQREVGRRKMAMLTTTIPRVSDDVEREVSEFWPEIVRVFLQELERACVRAGCQKWTVGCTEVQERRMAIHGGFPLHLHVVFHARKGKNWSYRPKFYQELWKRILVHYVPGLSEASFASSTRVEGIEKDAGSYLAKYASKGVKGSVLEMMGEGYRIPTGWVHLTGGIKATIKKQVVYFCDKRADLLLQCVFKAPQIFKWVGDVKIPVLGNERGDGVRGVLREVSIAWYGSLLWKFSELIRRGFSPHLHEPGTECTARIEWLQFSA